MLALDVARAFADPDGDALTFAVSSAAPDVATAGLARPLDAHVGGGGHGDDPVDRDRPARSERHRVGNGN